MGKRRNSSRLHLAKKREAHDYLMRHGMPGSGPVVRKWVDPKTIQRDAEGRAIMPPRG